MPHDKGSGVKEGLTFKYYIYDVIMVLEHGIKCYIGYGGYKMRLNKIILNPNEKQSMTLFVIIWPLTILFTRDKYNFRQKDTSAMYVCK